MYKNQQMRKHTISSLKSTMSVTFIDTYFKLSIHQEYACPLMEQLTLFLLISTAAIVIVQTCNSSNSVHQVQYFEDNV
jgi:type IV secretory pathway TraG/TraD family ATPase VirD4